MKLEVNILDQLPLQPGETYLTFTKDFNKDDVAILKGSYIFTSRPIKTKDGYRIKLKPYTGKEVGRLTKVIKYELDELDE